MAELDKDRVGTSGYGRQSPPGEGSTTWTAGSGDRATMDTGAQSFEQTAAQAKERAAEFAHRAQEQGRDMFASQKDRAAGQVDSVARALRTTADQLSGEDRAQAEAGRYIGYAAEQLQSFGQRLREKDLDGLLHDVQYMARRSPMAFFAGSVAAGFLLSRFLKSSSERAGDPDRYRGQERMAEGLHRMRGEDRDASDTRASYMDTDAAGTMADMDASSVELRTTTPAPGGGSTEQAPLPTGDSTRGGRHGL